jgi:hypothetical protein
MMVITGQCEMSDVHTIKLSIYFDTPQEIVDLGSNYDGGEFLEQLARAAGRPS